MKVAIDCHSRLDSIYNNNQLSGMVTSLRSGLHIIIDQINRGEFNNHGGTNIVVYHISSREIIRHRGPNQKTLQENAHFFLVELILLL